MIISSFKYLILISTITIPLASASDMVPTNNTQRYKPNLPQEKLTQLESSFGGRIGVYALNTNNGQIIAYRANERFPVQSTMKIIGAAALLKLSESNESLLQEKVQYTKDDLIGWTPVTKLHLDKGMTLIDLAEAAVTYSDNTAINSIMRRFGGPRFSTNFALSIGNSSYNVTHYDGYMNSNPKNPEDTSTPKDMAISVQNLTLGKTLNQSQRQLLTTWMRNTVTSYKLIRAGVPMGWAVADKSGGSGDYGVRNDIGIAWSPSCKPVVLAIYTVQNKKEAQSRDDIIALTTNIIFDEFAKHDNCFKN